MPIDLSLSDENKLVQSSVRDFCAHEIEPHIREWDSRHEVHREVFVRMAELGLLGAPIPEQYGGAGKSLGPRSILRAPAPSRVTSWALTVGAADSLS